MAFVPGLRAAPESPSGASVGSSHKLRRKSWTATLDQSDPHTLFAARHAYGDQSMPGEDRSGGNTMQGCAAIFFRPSSGPES
jgi:hypothetical protein